MTRTFPCFLLLILLFTSLCLCGEIESLWIEAEHLDGIKGSCWPMGKPEMKKTAGHWGLSGPGWAAEWTQGGESGFLSIACAADDDAAVATKKIEIPATGNYRVWVRYRDAREASDRFQISIEQNTAWSATYGEKAVIDEDNEMKLYWNWAFAWEAHDAALQKGPATLALKSVFKEADCRQIDCIVLTTDMEYRPLIKERPRNPLWKMLDSYRGGVPDNLEPLARRTKYEIAPAAWKPKTFNDRGFLYLWNTSQLEWAKPDTKIPYVWHISDKEAKIEFEKKFAGQKDLPIFSDPRIVPAFHGTAVNKFFATDSKTAAEKTDSENFVRWLDENPKRLWAMMMNYAPEIPQTPAATANFFKYRDRFVGRIAGESLGYFYPDHKAPTLMQAKSRREWTQAFGELALDLNRKKWSKVFNGDFENHYSEVIPCLSIGMPTFAPIIPLWGSRNIGYESSSMSTALLSMRWAFLRGAARQMKTLTTTYRSCNFGDASTIFSDTQHYSAAKNILDNFYSVYSGAGMTWYKMDIWYQYMCGASMFYHEQGFDEFWMPGGTAAAGQHGLQLSPKGKLVDRFLRVTAKEPERGTPVTPVAFLVDYAHGWEPSPFSPAYFGSHGSDSLAMKLDEHAQMLHEYFFTAYHPIGPISETPITGTNEVYVPGVFGDIFDVIYAYPDTKLWTTIDTYPVVIVAGDIALTAQEGERLAKYVNDGGTLLVAAGQLSGPGAEALMLPGAQETQEASGYRWLGAETLNASQRFKYSALNIGRAIAQTSDGKTFCASIDRGNGRLVYLSVPRGLGIDQQGLPVLAQLFAHLSRGLMPIEVSGGVEWMLNRSENSWYVTLLNPAGQDKPQQGITPTDYRQNRKVTIRAKVAISSARDWLIPDEKLIVVDGKISCEVLAGGVRVIELK